MQMKIFGWMQNKITAKFNCNNTNSTSVNHHQHHHHNANRQANEEFSDWPHGLLAIGTFGNTNKAVKEEENEGNSKPESNQENQVEEAEERIQKELDSSVAEDECRNNNVFESSLVVGGPKTLNQVDNTHNNINKKSFSFLLKKIFVCKGGFTPALNLKDQLPESTMEKRLRAILHKKIYPQNPNSPTKKVLPNKRKPTCDEESKEDDDKGSKWVKTDSEYIVLEI